jgi:hypothetical protein
VTVWLLVLVFIEGMHQWELSVGDHWRAAAVTAVTVAPAGTIVALAKYRRTKREQTTDQWVRPRRL